MLLVKHTGHAANGHCSHPPVAPLRRPSDGAESALRATLGASVTGIFVTERAEQQFIEAGDRQCGSSCTPKEPTTVHSGRLRIAWRAAYEPVAGVSRRSTRGLRRALGRPSFQHLAAPGRVR
jgi:hypothetical protein